MDEIHDMRDEEWVEKCLSCKHCYKKKTDDITLYCRCKKGKCNYEEYKSKSDKEKR